MGLDWPLALELIQRSTAAANARGAVVASGAGTDHLPAGAAFTLQEVINAYLRQCEAIEAVEGRIILMASRALAAVARHADDYASVYATVLGQVRQPVILHWLGPMFDPALQGYWGGDGDRRGNGELPRGDSCATKKKSMASRFLCWTRNWKSPMRRELPPGVRMYTGDDFNYDRLILGDDQRLQRCIAGDFRCHRSGCFAGAGSARCR